MSDNIPKKQEQEELVKELSCSESDGSNSAGSTGAFLKPPRNPWGPSGRREAEILGKRRHTSDSESSNGDPDEPDVKAEKLVSNEHPDDPQIEQEDKENEIPALIPDQPEFLEVERYFPSSSDEEDAKSDAATAGDDSATVDYSTKNVRYHIALEGSIPVYDAPVVTGNSVTSFLRKILRSKVDGACRCEIPGSHVTDPDNEGKEFTTADKAISVKCSNPETCNMIDISGATYVAEREKNARQVIRLRNRGINFGDEYHYYRGKKISEYTDFVHVGGYIHLYAKLGPDGDEMELFKKDAVKIFLRRA